MFARDIRYGTLYRFVWNLTLSMDYLDFLYGYMFVGCGVKKPNPRMNSCMESRVGNPPFEVGFMV